MSRAKRPLNIEAVKKADAEFHAKHPELKGKPLSGSDPKQADLRKEWMALYKKNSGEIEKPNKKPQKTPKEKIEKCPSLTKAIDLKKCDEIKKHVKEGDIVLRGESGDSESEFIAKVSKCEFSHAGIVARDGKGNLVVVDAYPGRGKSGAIASHSVDDFFCAHNATQGLVTRPKDCIKSKKAAQWALEQTKDPDYSFALFDPWNKNPKDLYCSDFVYQSYQNAGLDLVPNKMDFLSPKNKANTLSAARDFNWKGRLLTDSKLEKRLLEKTGGGSDYITPCQVAKNTNTETVVNFDKP